VAIIIISLGISLLITIAYKLFTDQKLMKELKEDMKKAQKEMKEFSKDPAKVMNMQKEAMKKNMEYLKHSMKPTLITFLPIIIIFGWLNANFAYLPVSSNTEFTTSMIFDQGIDGEAEFIVPKGITLINDEPKKKILDGMAQWKLKGEEGDYVLEYKFNDKSYTQELLVTNGHGYKQPVQRIKELGLKEIRIDNQPLRPFGKVEIFGWQPGWLATYIIFSIIFSIVLRKVMKVH